MPSEMTLIGSREPGSPPTRVQGFIGIIGGYNILYFGLYTDNGKMENLIIGYIDLGSGFRL